MTSDNPFAVVHSSAKESITPSILIDGRTIPLEGWMFVCACALAGIPWALEDYQRNKNDILWSIRCTLLREMRKQQVPNEEMYARTNAFITKLKWKIETVKKEMGGI